SRLGSLPVTRGMRVGLFGGSFDPAHEGHAHVARTAMRRLRLHRVVWLVSPQNPLKRGRPPASLAKRMAGARAFAQSPGMMGPGMIVSDLETRLGSVFTVDTLRTLKARHPGVKFVWIMGSDSLANFHRWRGWRTIFREIPVAVVARPQGLVSSRFAPAAQRFAHARRPERAAGLLASAAPPAWAFLGGRLHYASSTELRRKAIAAAAG
ncbi:MAG: nicotinate-nucleotide adenylyltransferase, partial [Caulobacteraceae bacterium]